MSKKFLAVVAIGCGACVALAIRSRQGDQPRPWEKMRRFMEDMPADFPPRIMFDNVAATRENTERILAILEPAGGPGRSEELAEV